MRRREGSLGEPLSSAAGAGAELEETGGPASEEVTSGLAASPPVSMIPVAANDRKSVEKLAAGRPGGELNDPSNHSARTGLVAVGDADPPAAAGGTYPDRNAEGGEALLHGAGEREAAA